MYKWQPDTGIPFRTEVAPQHGFLYESMREYDGEMPHNQLCHTNNLVQI